MVLSLQISGGSHVTMAENGLERKLMARGHVHMWCSVKQSGCLDMRERGGAEGGMVHTVGARLKMVCRKRRVLTCDIGWIQVCSELLRWRAAAHVHCPNVFVFYYMERFLASSVNHDMSW